MYRSVSSYRICGNDNSLPVLDLGQQALTEVLRRLGQGVETGGMFASSGILFNHESTRRGSHQRRPRSGPLFRQPGYAPCLGYAVEYVELLWMMLQQDKPGDYCKGTGRRTPRNSANPPSSKSGWNSRSMCESIRGPFCR